MKAKVSSWQRDCAKEQQEQKLEMHSERYESRMEQYRKPTLQCVVPLSQA